MLPRSMSEHFAVVPPMSRAMMFWSPISAPSRAAPQTPEAGPDSIIVIGVRAAAWRESMPPLDCMT